MSTTTAPATTHKALFRQLLGNTTYRFVTQLPRLVQFILKPKHEPEAAVMHRFVTAGMVCFDIGANYGHYSRVMSPLAGKTGRVYSFEPSAITCKALKWMTVILGLRNVTVTHAAMAETQGQMTLTIPIKAHGGLGIALAHLGDSVDREGITETVDVLTFDGFIAAQGITRCDFIKCDVEGAELRVLMGAEQTIRKFQPTILLEVSASYMRRNGHTQEQLAAFIEQLGYVNYTLNGDVIAPSATLRDSGNNFLLPKSRPLPA